MVACRRTGQLAALLLGSCLLCACDWHGGEPAPLPPSRVELARTTHGIVHVTAANFRGLGMGLAYAYAQDNLCMLADSLLTVRGERSRYFGGATYATAPANGEYGAASFYLSLNNEDSDFFFKGYLDLAPLRAAYAGGAQEARDLLEGYAGGYNRYLRDTGGRYPAACAGAAWVRPITADDVMLLIAEKALHASGEVFAQEIVDAARIPGQAPIAAHQPVRRFDARFVAARLARARTDQLGSNGLAIGRDLSANGRGILLGNPHYPWTSTDRFYQAHLTIPGRYDAMGVTLGGLPMVVIGFNRDVAWTHTVTQARHFTTVRLALDTRDRLGTTYLVDGAAVPMTSRTVSVELLEADGRIRSKSKTFWFSQHGAVLVKSDAGLDWSRSVAYVLADANRDNTRLMAQWIAIGSARNVGQLKGALDQIVGLPWVNTIAADREGGTLYADASVVPHVSADKFASNCLINEALLTFDGARSACGWGADPGVPAGISAPASGPWLMRSDYVGNSNDSYWLSNPRALLEGPAPRGYSPLYGRTGVEQMLRTRIGFLQMEERIAEGRPFALEDAQTLMFADRIYAAELVLPELLPACFRVVDAALLPACQALAAWDRRANLDSRGAVLFREFWNIASAIDRKWVVAFDPADPVRTPRGLAPAAVPAMLGALASAARKLQALGVALDGRLGDYQDETRGGVRVPLHGAVGDIDGSYNSIHLRSALDARGYHDIAWGSSYIQSVGFDDAGPLAFGLLAYGQSVDPASPYYSDQLPLYSAKRWPQLPFTAQQVRSDPEYRPTVLEE
ncbi:penicillin acylase family protein [Massilia sp. PWRC2]|uniref:penicillin acylase family protein n=1 Tax=Massilia sp. PWRC2 TaxID=2804626 RepID=UPI003CF146B1